MESAGIGRPAEKGYRIPCPADHFADAQRRANSVPTNTPVKDAADRWRAAKEQHDKLPDSKTEARKKQLAKASIQDLAACLQAYGSNSNWYGGSPIEPFPKRIAKWLHLQMAELEAGSIPRYFRRCRRRGGAYTHSYLIKRCKKVAVAYVMSGDPQAVLDRKERVMERAHFNINRRTLNRWLKKHANVASLADVAPEFSGCLAIADLEHQMSKHAQVFQRLRKPGKQTAR